MTRRGLLAVALLAGCAMTQGATIDDSRTARLPEGDRQAIIAANQNVDVAKANLTAAKVAKDEAKKFQKIADRELDAAKSRVDASRDGMSLGRQARSESTLNAAQAAYDVATRELLAAKAKKDYADRLQDLRDAQVDEQEAGYAAAKTDLEWAKYESLERNGMAENLDRARFERARAEAQNELAQRRMRTAEMQGMVAQLRTNWDQRRRDFNTASRDLGERPIQAPMPPEMLEEPQSPIPPPRQDANEGPSGPQSVPVEKPYQNQP